MSNEANSKAKAVFEQSAGGTVLSIGGTWQLTEPFPHVEEVMPKELDKDEINVVSKDLAEWDSSLPLFLLRVRTWCNGRRVKMNMADLPDAVKRLLEIISQSEEQGGATKTRQSSSLSPARIFNKVISKLKNSVQFVGECVIGMMEIPAKPRHFHWKTFFAQMIEAGPKALPIVGLLSFLVGLTFGYETSIQLRRFGLQFYMVNAAGTSIFRQIGPVIAAILLAGRTGAAFAAHIANMKLGNEIAALEMIGVSPVTFLVLPRLAALFFMLPLITLYSDFFGILGPLVIAVFKLNIPVDGFLIQLSNAISLSDFLIGVIKSFVFALLIGFAGTWHGLESERSSAGLGRSVTAAVVTGIAAVLTADALFSPVLEHLGF